MVDLLLALIDMIIQAGISNQKDVDIFRDVAPKDPDSCIILYEYAGSAPAMFTATTVRSVQIVARDKNGQAAKQKLWQIYKLLYREDYQIDIAGKKCLIAMRNTPIAIDTDELNRKLYAFNMGITISFI